jgi:glycerophosphoryl diester phosphodiesterase
VLAVAHRAGNHIATLQEAARLGADVIEAGVLRHRGRLEVRHTTSQWDRSEVQPLLGALLDALPSHTTVMLDLKGVGRTGLEVARELHARSPDHPLLVCARWWPSVLPFRDTPWAGVLLSARGRSELLRLRRRLQTGTAPDGVSVHLSLLTREVVAELREKVDTVLTWPVDDDDSLDRAHRLGVGGVITKDLDVLRQVVADR